MTAARAELRERLNALRWQMQNRAARNDPGSFARLKQEYLCAYNIGEAKLEALDKRLRLAGNQTLQTVTAAAENINQAMQRLLGDGIIGAEAAMAGPQNPFGRQFTGDPLSAGNGGYDFFAHNKNRSLNPKNRNLHGGRGFESNLKCTRLNWMWGTICRILNGRTGHRANRKVPMDIYFLRSEAQW